jgi:ATP-binding cassette subfamily B protein
MQKPIKEKIQQALRIDRGIHLVWQAAPGWTAINLILQTIQGILPLAALYLMKLIIDSVTLSINAADKTEAFNQILLFIAVAAGVALLVALCQLLSNMANQSKWTWNIMRIPSTTTPCTGHSRKGPTAPQPLSMTW